MNEEKTLEVIDVPDEVTIPRAEYDELKKARWCIDLIGSTLNSYGGDDKIIVALCKQFGYEKPEDKPNA